MKFPRALRKTIAAFAFCLVAAGACFASSSISLDEYRQQLGDIAQKVGGLSDHPEQAANVEVEIPASVTVSTNSGEITVNYQHLKDDLAEFFTADAKKRPELFQHIQSYLQTLQREAEAYASAGSNVAAAEQKAREILARREFRKVRGPGAREAFLAKIYSWLARLLSRLHGPGKGTYSVIQVMVWVFLGAVVLVLIVWTAKRLMRPEEAPAAREIIPFAPSARNWRSWLAEAREAAAQQDWRSAIHLAYWAGISFLESSGAWKPNRARTPREYLRLLSSRNPHHPTLSALTRKFEVVWYGHRNAAEADFQETLGQLEKLGCR